VGSGLLGIRRDRAAENQTVKFKMVAENNKRSLKVISRILAITKKNSLL
jgi:hypothetical protein